MSFGSQEKDFDGTASRGGQQTVALAPYDTFMLSRLTMVLVQVGRPDQALRWADQAAARDPALGWFYNYGKGWAHLLLGDMKRPWMLCYTPISTTPIYSWQ